MGVSNSSGPMWNQVADGRLPIGATYTLRTWFFLRQANVAVPRSRAAGEWCRVHQIEAPVTARASVAVSSTVIRAVGCSYRRAGSGWMMGDEESMNKDPCDWRENVNPEPTDGEDREEEDDEIRTVVGGQQEARRRTRIRNRHLSIMSWAKAIDDSALIGARQLHRRHAGQYKTLENP